MNTDQLIAKLDELIAATRSAAIPANMRWLSAESMAAMLDMSPRQFAERLACKPGFPACHNRPELTAYLHPSGELIPHRMSQPCKAWSTGDRATPVPVLEGWQCAGCRWLPRADILRFAQITLDLALASELMELAK